MPRIVNRHNAYEIITKKEAKEMILEWTSFLNLSKKDLEYFDTFNCEKVRRLLIDWLDFDPETVRVCE